MLKCTNKTHNIEHTSCEIEIKYVILRANIE